MAGFLRQKVVLMSTTYFPQASTKGGDPLLVRLPFRRNRGGLTTS
jgi:hypothetical protein